MGLFDFFSAKPAQDAAQARIAGQNAGYSQLSDLFNQGRTDLTSNVGTATDLYKPLVASTTAGAGAYGDATGANGQEGLSRAADLFTHTPGYQEGINLTLDQNDRRNASRGILASGNTLGDTAKLATDYSTQHYGDYVKNLSPYLGANGSAVGGAAGLYTGLGTGLAAADTAQGQAAQATQTGIGNANADADLAKYQASGNFWNTLIGGAQAVAKAYAGGK